MGNGPELSHWLSQGHSWHLGEQRCTVSAVRSAERRAGAPPIRGASRGRGFRLALTGFRRSGREVGRRCCSGASGWRGIQTPRLVCPFLLLDLPQSAALFSTARPPQPFSPELAGGRAWIQAVGAVCEVRVGRLHKGGDIPARSSGISGRARVVWTVRGHCIKCLICIIIESS